ncbi:hypothetical protein B296_00003424 [Ensete ventricosum]|uniref:Uncharacterized protein n=1 Tax=Ensete ventricosum TaxID=4639 RepID=A0A427BCL0_ENSVE|nr:hypothetical protein B296_00003424 [Ensete ventricosum]
MVVREWLLVSDIAPKMSQPNEVFDMVFEVVAFLRVMFVLSVEAALSSFVMSFGACCDGVRGPTEPLSSDLEEDLYSDGEYRSVSYIREPIEAKSEVMKAFVGVGFREVIAEQEVCLGTMDGYNRRK